jgi:hypothetical protein
MHESKKKSGGRGGEGGWEKVNKLRKIIEETTQNMLSKSKYLKKEMDIS